MYELPLWRFFRQISAIQRWRKEEQRENAVSVRAAQAKDENFRSYIRSLGVKSRTRQSTIKSARDAARFGLGYKEGK